MNHPHDDHLIGCFQAVEQIKIEGCKSFRNIFTPTTAKFDLRALRSIDIEGGADDNLEKSEEEEEEEEEEESVQEEIDDISKGQIVQVADNILYVAYPFNLLRTFHHLKSLTLSKLSDVVTVFEIENATSRDLTNWDNQQPPILCHLKDLRLYNLKKMNYVWKCTWNYFLNSQKQRESSFQNLTTIILRECGKIKYLFSLLMVKLLFNLKTIDVSKCDGFEEIVSNRDDDIQTMVVTKSSRMNPNFFPHLDSLYLSCLPKLKCIYDGATRGQEMNITECRSMREIFEIEGNSNKSCHGTDVDDECRDTHTAVITQGLANMIMLELPKLTILRINQCDLLEHVFTSSTLESLKQLEKLTVENCKAMQVIVEEDDLKEDGEHTTSKVVVFPQLKSLRLTDLPNVRGFFLGMNEFQWPQLEKVKIFGCPQLMEFTPGHSTTPKLNYMYTGVGKHSLECGLNFHLTTASNETEFRSSSSMMCSTPPADMIYPLCSFSNLVEVDTYLYGESSERRIFFPHNELHKLQNLEKLNIRCGVFEHNLLEEVFEVVEETNDYLNETQSFVVVAFPKLKEVILQELESVKHIWKSNRRTVLNFPNLTKVSINDCLLLRNVLTSCMVGSLSHLQELHISECENMEVIVKQVEEDSDTRANEVVVFPRLKSVTLSSLKNIKGFYLGPEAFMWPSLDTLKIKYCPQITVFTSGQSTTPKLKVIDTSFGLCNATEDPTSFIKTKQQEGWGF